MTNSNSESTTDWKQVVIDIIIKIITLGLYHVEKHHNQANGSPE